MDDLNKVIEKIIKLRIEKIIEKGEIDEKTGNKIKDINEYIIKNNKFKVKNRISKNISKDDKILTARTTFIKDMSRIIKNESNLNYLPINIVKKIEGYKDKKQTEKLSFYNILWKDLDNETKDKYKKICNNKDFTNSKYDEIVN